MSVDKLMMNRWTPADLAEGEVEGNGQRPPPRPWQPRPSQTAQDVVHETLQAQARKADPIAELIRERGERYGPVQGVADRLDLIMVAMEGIPDGVGTVERYCLMMMAVKFARLIGNPGDWDTLQDINGYVRLIMEAREEQV